MLRVHRTDAGEIVLIHEPTSTVVVDDTFDGALARLEERLGDGFRSAVTAAPPEMTRIEPPARTPWARWALVGSLVALPFVWLGALHVSLGSLAVELRRDAIDGDKDEQADREDQATLKAEVDAIGGRVDRLVDKIAKLERAAKKNPMAAQAPSDEELADEDDEGEGEDEGEEEDQAEETAAAKAPQPKASPRMKAQLGAQKDRAKVPPT